MSEQQLQGALRNVGELASPYFLLELWARREEIDLDSDTYTSLKRKARALVRDARGFEHRAEDPDEEWRSRRRELLGLEWLVERALFLEDGTEFPLLIWPDRNGHEALLVGDLPGFIDSDARSKDETDPPSTRFELALDQYEGDADWGLLLAGLELRVYRRSSGISQQYLALSLDNLVELDDDANWRAFAGLFRAPAFALDEEGVPLIRRVVDESRRHAAALADDMRRDVVDAAEAIIQGALDHPANAQLLSDPSRETLHALFEQTLYYLYRLLFILFAEARDVLPLSGAGPYATTYSVDHLIELARTENENADGTYYSDSLRHLYALLWQGPPEKARALGIEPVGGELFDPARTELVDPCIIADPVWRRALTSLALGAPGSPRRRLGRRSSFAELGVDQLGSIYEGLLVLEPFLSRGPRLLVREGNDRRVVLLGGEGSLRAIRALQAGDFILESASGRRKGSGSFYTPVEITEYLAHSALDPIVEPIVDRAAESPVRAETELLTLRVCDPAMGSGAFLVQAARVLGRALARIRALRGDGRVTPEMVRTAEREVVRTCIYGVDLNPLAVVLAKVSLWLETLEKGKPLSFLDAHLRCGDSLVGVDFVSVDGTITVAELTQWPKDAVKGLKAYLKSEGGERGKPILERLAIRKAISTAKQARLPGLDTNAVEKALQDIAGARVALATGNGDTEPLQMELSIAQAFKELEEAEDSLRNRLRLAADFWCAQWFSEGEDAPEDEKGPIVPVGQSDFEGIMAKLIAGEAISDHLKRNVEAAQQVTGRRHFFHWALEFPEVILDRGGFDAVIGNPPWNTLSPDNKEFFSTYDHLVFRKGVPQAEQEKRKNELREDNDVDVSWRAEARFLYELSHYAKPESKRFLWYAPEGQLRKGDANVFRLFVERAYKLLREGGRLAQVLPESFYTSSPATGLRQHLLTDGRLELCFVFENRKKIFPIGSNIKVALVGVQSGEGPTEGFRASFFVGKDPAGQDRAVGLEELPSVLAQLDNEAPVLSVDQIRALAPATWSFPELQTALDAEIAARCASNFPSLNLDDRGWGLTYCAELHAERDARRFKDAGWLASRGARPTGIRWIENNGTEWWPLVEGYLFYELEFPAEGKRPKYWVEGPEVAAIEARKNRDGSSVMEHYRVAWRKVARTIDERSAVAAVIPPRTACKDSSYTVWGGSIKVEKVLSLAALLSSFCLDYLVRFAGRSNLTYAAVNSLPAPSPEALSSVVGHAVEVVCASEDFDELWRSVRGKRQSRPVLDPWALGERRARIDAEVALAYGLNLEEFGALLSTFPNIDRSQRMLPGEPKSFVTRDLALLAYCEATDAEPADIAKLLAAIGVSLPEPRPEYRRLDQRIAKYREIGAIPYRPTPRGGRKPTDPELIAAVVEQLSSDPQAGSEIAEALEEEEEEAVVVSVLKTLVKEGQAYAEGRGKSRRYYVIEDE